MKGRTISEKAEGDVENAFRNYARAVYREHDPLIEDGMEGPRKFVAWIMANHPDAHGEIKRVFAGAPGRGPRRRAAPTRTSLRNQLHEH